MKLVKHRCFGQHRMWPWRVTTKYGFAWFYPCCDSYETSGRVTDPAEGSVSE